LSKRIVSLLAKWFLGVLLALALLKALVWWLQPRLAFYPRRGPTPPPDPYVRFETTTEDGMALTGWMMPPDSAKPVIIYFCGNAGNLSDRAALLSGFDGKAVTVVAFNYRGMGESSGSPTEQGVYRDATAIYRYVTETLSIDPHRVILWGHSIGGAVAAWLATEKPCAGLLLESTFRSAKAMAKRMLPVIPASFFLTYRFDNEGHMRRLRVPILLLHGTADTIIPPEDSQLLYSLASGPKDLWLIPQGGHNDLSEVAGSSFYDRISSFANKVSSHSLP
jgi:fermentation-respiration switch protein FrsA (DUF1100 family)